MAAELIEALDEETLRELIRKTVATGRSIATLHLALRMLKEADPALLEKLEAKIGARRYLHLIASNGNIFELFKVLQYSSPSLTAELIGALDYETLSCLIEKTVATGRSIGTLPFTLRELKISEPRELDRLERKIGVNGWWRLILANGKINGLAPLMKYMSDAFRQEMVQASRLLTTADWDELLVRGDLSDLSVFIRIGEGYSPKLMTNALIERLSPTFKKLIYTADWPTLRLSTYRLSESPDSELGHHLHHVLKEHLDKTDLASLRFDKFEEAAACVSTLERALPAKRGELVRLLFDILPKEDNWYDASFLQAARAPLFLLASSTSPVDTDRRMLDACNNKQVAALLMHASLLDALLYLWNLYSLWFKSERIAKGEARTTFGKFINSEIQLSIDHAVRRCLQSSGGKSEKQFRLMLLGFLHAAGLMKFKDDDRAQWQSIVPSFDDLMVEVEQTKSFLLATFFLIGSAWVYDRAQRIPSHTLSTVLSKANAYTETSAALENLRRLLSARLRNMSMQPATERR